MKKRPRRKTAEERHSEYLALEMPRLNTTHEVVEVLSRRTNWMFFAPNTDNFFPCTASTDGIHISFVTHYPTEDGGSKDGSPPIRCDWVRIPHTRMSERMTEAHE